jgi:hypothetical protein
MMGPLIEAIFAGNGIIIKGSEQTAWSAQYNIQVARAALTACGHDPDLVQARLFPKGGLIGRVSCATLTSLNISHHTPRSNMFYSLDRNQWLIKLLKLPPRLNFMENSLTIEPHKTYVGIRRQRCRRGAKRCIQRRRTVLDLDERGVSGSIYSPSILKVRAHPRIALD